MFKRSTLEHDIPALAIQFSFSGHLILVGHHCRSLESRTSNSIDPRRLSQVRKCRIATTKFRHNGSVGAAFAVAHNPSRRSYQKQNFTASDGHWVEDFKQKSTNPVTKRYPLNNWPSQKTALYSKSFQSPSLTSKLSADKPELLCSQEINRPM